VCERERERERERELVEVVLKFLKPPIPSMKNYIQKTLNYLNKFSL
jgi:hypothetical protein